MFSFVILPQKKEKKKIFIKKKKKKKKKVLCPEILGKEDIQLKKCSYAIKHDLSSSQKG